MIRTATVTLISVVSEEGNGQSYTWEVKLPDVWLFKPDESYDWTRRREPGMITMPPPVCLRGEQYLVKS